MSEPKLFPLSYAHGPLSIAPVVEFWNGKADLPLQVGKCWLHDRDSYPEHHSFGYITGSDADGQGFTIWVDDPEGFEHLRQCMKGGGIIQFYLSDKCDHLPQHPQVHFTPEEIFLFRTDNGIPVFGPADPEERRRKIAYVLHELALPRIEAIKKALAAQSLPDAQEEALNKAATYPPDPETPKDGGGIDAKKANHDH